MTALDDEPRIDWDALSGRERAALGVPMHCPTWCNNDHRQAIDEGCEPHEARVHVAGDYAHQGHPVGNEQPVRWGLWLRADPGPGGWGTGLPFIELEVGHAGSAHTDRFSGIIDTGTARVLAAQLLHFADLGDLHT